MHRHASAADRALQQSSPPINKRWISWSRVWDLLALLVIAFVVWKLLVAPRALSKGSAVPAPHIVLASLQGVPFTLVAHRGHVVFLDFFASWCEPCKISLPLVSRFARAHPEVEVIPIDVGEPPGIVAPFARQYQLQSVALDRDQLAMHWFGVAGLPTMVVIDPRGNIRATWPGLNPAIQLNMANAESQLRGGG